ncbi:MAG TPA: zinc metalloprotease [Rhodanobacteraceae bacterium]|nr:zinc metalloprotease [Rhodanobacteraceae bacterium]
MRIISAIPSCVGAAALCLLVAFGSAHAAGRRSDDTGSPDRFGPALDQAFQAFSESAPSTASAATDAQALQQIDIVFHVLSGPGSAGNLGNAVLDEQLAVMNAAYRSVGFHFDIAEVRRYPDSPYFAGGCFPTIEEGIRMKTELAVDPARYVNVYTCALAYPLIVGYGTLPDEFPEADARHGIVVDYRALPGGPAPLSLGHTLVHEAGHYLGLLHPFQGGCAEPGDGVADTPAEAGPTFGCPADRDSCPQGGLDPVTNFMDYSEDACTNEFTPLQSARMRALTATFRPRLAARADFAIGPGMTGNWYDPAQSGHGFSIEVLPGNQMLAEWFVFAPDSGPLWIIATGPITGDTAVLQAYRTVGTGARFPPDFDPTAVQNAAWGTLVFRFTDCNNGQVSWQPVVAGYNSGSMPITRLTMPAGLGCP